MGPVTRRRYASETWVAGEPVKGSFEDTTVFASVQPLKSRDQQILPEGERMSDWRKLYVYPETDLRTTDQHTGLPEDQIFYKNVWYEISKEDPYDESAPLPHKRLYMKRVQE